MRPISWTTRHLMLRHPLKGKARTAWMNYLRPGLTIYVNKPYATTS